MSVKLDRFFSPLNNFSKSICLVMHRTIFACYCRTRILQGLIIEVWWQRWTISLKIVKFVIVPCVIYLLIISSNKCTTHSKNPKDFIKRFSFQLAKAVKRIKRYLFFSCLSGDKFKREFLLPWGRSCSPQIIMFPFQSWPSFFIYTSHIFIYTSYIHYTCLVTAFFFCSLQN